MAGAQISLHSMVAQIDSIERSPGGVKIKFLSFPKNLNQYFRVRSHVAFQSLITKALC
jgi:hypothetical protein